MKEVKILENKKIIKPKLRVVAYARVSSDKEAMLNSLSNQVSYYSKLIKSNKAYIFKGVYVDEGVSGTKSDRAEFNKMLEKARLHEFDYIVTKSISRFARNTLTLLNAIRELKELGIGVYFEEQRINTLTSEGELMITILASFAQEEARSVSENMKWRIKEKFKKGEPWSTKIYGYVGVDGVFKIVPDEAEVVRLIYKLYLEGLGMDAIALILKKKGYKTRTNGYFAKSTIHTILRNITYTGNLLLQKTFRPDYITKRYKQNKGELDKYYVENAHEPIVSLEDFNKVQELIELRNKNQVKTKEHTRKYPFSGILICGHCKSKFRRVKTAYNIKWMCRTYSAYGTKECNSKAIPEDELIRITKVILNVNDINFDVVQESIDHIDVFNNNTLIYYLKNNQVIKASWKDKSRSESWTSEMKNKARERALNNAKHS